jgi:hypothetical protein
LQEYTPHLYRYVPHLHGVGVEGLTFVMESKKYAGHFKEHGWNAIQFANVSNAWIRGTWNA